MFAFGKRYRKIEELERAVSVCRNNAENNYKDAAQGGYQDFRTRYEELKAKGALDARQREHYEQLLGELEEAMKGFWHTNH